MLLNTASQVISLARKLEEDGAALYEVMARLYPQYKDTLLTFSTENRKNITQMERAYYEASTDALEGCFAFALDTVQYESAIQLSENSSFAEAIQKSIVMEEKITAFYIKAAEQSKSLLADVPRVFIATVKKRSKRLQELHALAQFLT